MRSSDVWGKLRIFHLVFSPTGMHEEPDLTSELLKNDERARSSPSFLPVVSASSDPLQSREIKSAGQTNFPQTPNPHADLVAAAKLNYTIPCIRAFALSERPPSTAGLLGMTYAKPVFALLPSRSLDLIYSPQLKSVASYENKH